jgi:hypothetical protein
MESERLVEPKSKVDYWFYYFENGNKRRRAHYSE